MRKLVILSIALISFVMTSCSSNQCTPENLSELSSRYLSAAIAYGFSQSGENCVEYKAALQDYIEIIEDCDDLDDSDAEELKTIMSELDC